MEDSKRYKKLSLEKKERAYRKDQWKLFHEQSATNGNIEHHSTDSNSIVTTKVESFTRNELLLNLILKNSELLAKDLKEHLENNDKQTEFTVTEVHPLLYDSISKEFIKHFEEFNKNKIYTFEIESGKFSTDEIRIYYMGLLFEVLHKIILYQQKS
jgi:hypothetical protein